MHTIENKTNTIIDAFRIYMRYGFDRESARANALEDAEIAGVGTRERCRFSYLVKIGKV